MKYEVEIFDVKGNIPEITFFDSFYTKKEWKLFWDLINFKRDKYPTYFVVQNINELRLKNKKISEKIDDLIILYNNKMGKNHFVIYDFHEKLNPNDFGSLFLDIPGQFGLRGDPELWDELIEYYKGKSFPESKEELVNSIENTITELTGKSIIENESYFVEKYYNGSGMSGGMISREFWIYKAIPILIGRYMKIKNFC